MNENKSETYVIIGGVAGGATAAARIRRLKEKAEIILLEKGPYVSFANCGLPYFIGGDIKRRSNLLLQTPEGFFSRYRVDVRVHTEAVGIDRVGKTVLVKTPQGESVVAYDKLILAQGGSPLIPPLPGVTLDHVFKLWTIPDMDRIHKFIEDKKPRRALVAGGGFIGLEMAEALKHRGLEVTLVELAPQVMILMDQEFGAMVKSTLEEGGVTVKTGVGLSEIKENSVILSDGSTVETDMVLLSIGVRPELTLAKGAGLEIGTSGGLLVNDYLQTSDPYIYAAGDMIELVNKISGRKVRIPLAGPANRQGRIVGSNVTGDKVPYRGALGTSVVKIFDHTAAGTGLSEKAAREAGFDVGVAYTFKDNHVSYYPGGTMISFKLVYDMKTSRILGAMAFGKADVEKRIDVVATALHGKFSLEDLSELDLAYAPPYNGANDPINMASFVGMNHVSGYSPNLTPAQALTEVQTGRALILDVRTMGEQGKAPVAGVVHIPADEVRDRLEEIPRDKPLVILSKDGFLGHTTLQTLKAEGWKDVKNITGGYYAAKWTSGWDFQV